MHIVLIKCRIEWCRYNVRTRKTNSPLVPSWRSSRWKAINAGRDVWWEHEIVGRKELPISSIAKKKVQHWSQGYSSGLLGWFKHPSPPWKHGFAHEILQDSNQQRALSVMLCFKGLITLMIHFVKSTIISMCESDWGWEKEIFLLILRKRKTGVTTGAKLLSVRACPTQSVHNLSNRFYTHNVL